MVVKKQHRKMTLKEVFDYASKTGDSVIVNFNSDNKVLDFHVEKRSESFLNKLANSINGSVVEAGHFKFYVDCNRLDIYTVIGADNQHHASNKATKLFGPHWSRCSSLIAMNSTCFVTPTKFKELLATLPN